MPIPNSLNASPLNLGTAHLEEWCLIGGKYLVGEVTNHPTCYQGEYVRTTEVVQAIFTGESYGFITKSGTRYDLGEPAEGQRGGAADLWHVFNPGPLVVQSIP